MPMTSRQTLDAIDMALAVVSRRLASGELDQSGRYYSDEELRRQFGSSKSRPKSRARVRKASRRTPKTA